MENQNKMPEVVMNYVAASNDKDISKMLSLFSDDAVVKDEGAAYNGIKEIGEWQTKIHKAYDFKMEIKKVEIKDNNYIVTTTLSGTFPGKNPVDVEQCFVIENGRITALNIK
jgi:ketosteroid isomerase-like protein